MFAVTGITGKVGGEVARNLLTANQRVRAVVRDIGKGDVWSQRSQVWSGESLKSERPVPPVPARCYRAAHERLGAFLPLDASQLQEQSTDCPERPRAAATLF
jgi:hypothetical protein